MDGAPAIEFTGIEKRFPGVVALDDVSFAVRRGACHALCGENGAGKSTLSRILAGVMPPDKGEIRLDGKPVRFNEPRDALLAGIAMVHQELSFCDNMSVEENLFLGRIPRRMGLVSRRRLRDDARALLDSIGAGIDPAERVERLSVAQQQLVQIAAAVALGARVIIFDEPTSALGEREVERLYRLIAQLRAQDVTMLYISHRMPEVFALCDWVTVLRDGTHISTDPTASLDESDIVERMIGRRVEQYFPDHVAAAPGDEVLRVEHLSSPGRFDDISLALRAGEVVGVAGLTGAGRSELAQAIFGLDRNATGSIATRGTPMPLGSPREAMARGIGLVPEDRKRQGLVLAMRSRENITLPVLPAVSHLGWIDRGSEEGLAEESAARTQMRAGVLERPSLTLSGGNQQKVVLARWLAARSTILLLDEPTRGIDVGAKAELHAWIDRLAVSGAAVLLISSELPELINLSRRILVLREGRLVAQIPREAATQDVLVRAMTGLEVQAT